MMTEHEPLRVAQVGVGGFGRTRRERMRRTGLFKLMAAYDIASDALRAAKAEDDAEPVESYEALLEYPGIEAVVIATGASSHAEQMIQAMERGLHVYVEKPLCSSRAELDRIIDVWRRTRVVVGVGHMDHAAIPSSRLISQKIESGELGTIASFEMTTCHAGGQRLKPGDWRADPTRNPGGMLFQCGVHGLHELMHYFGEIVEVQAMGRDDVLPTETADVMLCQLRFSSGVVGTLNAYHCSPYRHKLNIYGTRANLYRYDLYFHEGTHLYQQTMGENPAAHQPRERLVLPEAAEDMDGMTRFYHAVRHAGEASPSLVHGARAVDAVFSLDRSARERKPVRIEPLFDGSELPQTSGQGLAVDGQEAAGANSKAGS